MSTAYDIGDLTLMNLAPTAVITTTGNQAGVDLLPFVGHALVILDSTAGTGTTPTDTVKLQDSVDNVTFTDTPNGAFTQLTTVASRQTLRIDTDAIGRYVRVVDTVTGTTPSYTRSVNVVGRKQVFP